MRHHYITAPAPEAAPLRLSMEEEVVALLEATDESNAADDILENVDRIVDIAQGVEDVQLITASVGGQLNTVDTALSEVVGDMIVAGSEADASGLFPATDTTVVDGIVTENFVEKIKSIWDNIIAMLKTAFEHVKAFFVKAFSVLESLKARCVDLKAKAKSRSKLTENSTKAALLTFDRSLFDDSATFTDGMLLSNMLNTNFNDLKDRFGKLPEQIGAVGVAIETAINGYPSGNSEAHLSAFAKKYHSEVNMLVSLATGGGTQSKDGVTEGKPLLGSFRVDARGAIADAKKALVSPKTTIAELSRVRFSGVSTEKQRSAFTLATPWSLASIVKILDITEKTIDLMLSARKGEIYKLLNGGVESLNRAGVSALAKDPEDKAGLEAIMRLVPAYANWVNNPLKDISKRGGQCLSAAISISSRMLERYE